MDQLCAITNSKKLPTSQKEIQEFYEAKKNEESQFQTFVSKVINSINATKRLKTSLLYDNEMKRVEKELNNKNTVFELNWSKEKQNIEEALMYSKYEMSCKNLFDRVDDFLTTLKYEDENYDQIKTKFAELESELNEKYSHGIKLKDTISSQLKAKNKVLLEEIEGIINKLSLANMRIKEEEEFNHQIKCINDQCKNLIEETNSQMNKWNLQTTKQQINQSDNESLNEINRVMEEVLKFKKITTRTSDHLLRNIREKLSQKFGLKNSGSLNDFEKNILENLNKVDLLIHEFMKVETSIRQAISKSELEEKEKLAVRKEEEEFNHQIKCINSQCKGLIEETKNQLNNWKLQTNKQPINQSDNESLNEINRIMEEMLKFKKNTTQTSDHLLRNIKEKLSHKFGLKNSGLLQHLENGLLEIRNKLDLLINEFVMIETNIRQAISKSELQKKQMLEVVQKEMTPPPRPPSPVIEDAVQKEATPPPRPPDPVSDSGRDTRDHSPASRSTTSGRELGPETLALKTLAAFERHSRPLGDLVPFPFLPDKQVSKPKKNKSKVPKPSKFTKGEMYYSDYESDFEGNIGVRWRGTQSDAEDVDSSYRKVKPILSKGFSQQSLDRKPSPPCPHQWESHEDIDILQEEIKNWNVLTKRVNTHKSDEKVNLMDNADSSDSEEPQYYGATAIVRCHSNMSNHSEYQRSTKEIELPQTLPAKQLVDDGPYFSMKSVESESYSEENTITTSSLSTVQTKTSSNYMKVKEKVMHFEKKVEEEHLRLALEEQFGECPNSPKVRPERIPGAVRVLPTPTPPGSRPGSRLGSGLSSRKNSLTRSSSTDNALFGATVNSASVLSRSVQPSPLFGRRYQEHPPPMFVPPDFKSQNFMVGHVQAETINQTSSSFSFTDQHNQMKSPPPLEIVDSNEMSRFNRYHPSQRRSRSRSIMSEDEEPERLSSPKLVIMANNLAKRDSIDGYDGDTDTLKSKKGSIKRNTSAVHEAATSSSQLTTSSQYFEIAKKQSNCSQSQIISQSLILNSSQQTHADNFPKSSGEMMPAKWLPQSVSDINHQPTYKSVKPCLSRNMSK